FGKSVEFCPRHPGVLDKLKLPFDVRIERYEMQSPFRIAGRGGLHGLFRRETGAVLAAAPQNPMEPDRSCVILMNTGLAKAKHVDQLRHSARGATRQIGRARIAAPYMRANRAAYTLRIGRIVELVQPHILLALCVIASGAHSGNRCLAYLRQRCTVIDAAADHGFRDAIAGLMRSARGFVDILPECMNILLELAEDEIRAVLA